MYQWSGFQQRKRTSRACVCVCVCGNIYCKEFLRSCGDWLGKSEICRVGHQEVQAGNRGEGADAVVHGEYSSSSGKCQFCSQACQLPGSGPPGYPG